MKVLHQNLASGKWHKLSLAKQIANIGSEVNRAIYWRKRGDKKNQEMAIWRALELVDLTISDRKRSVCLFDEIVRLREVLCDIFLGNNTYGTPIKRLQDYFLFFALIVQKNK